MSAPPNPDTRELPYGWIQQYNWDYKQWFYVNTREQPPRSSWEHPLGPIPQGFVPPTGAPPDRSYSRSPYGGPPQGYAGYAGYAPPPQGYYGAPPGGYASGPSYGPPGYRGAENQSYYPPQPQTVYVQDQHKQKKGPGIGTALLAGGAGLVGGALLMDAVEDHDQREREIGFGEGYQDGYDNGFDNGFDGGW